MKMNSSIIRVSDEVRDALASNRAVVALESTIFSHLGLPSPANASPAPVVSTMLATGGVATSVTAPAAVIAATGNAPRLITVSAAPGIGCAESMLSDTASSLLHRNTSGAIDAIRSE